MKNLFTIALLVPLFCFGQKDYCSHIKKKVDLGSATVTFKSPELKYFSAIKQFSVNETFALHIYIKDDHEHFEAKGAIIEFEDSTIIKDEGMPVDCRQEVSLIAGSGDPNGSGSYSGKYLLQGLFAITDDNVGLFTSKKIARITLENVSVKIHDKDATKIMNYIICLKDMRP